MRDSKPVAAAIYARISLDRHGDGLAVERQLSDARRKAAALGWLVAEEYVDNDVSASSGRRRPAYQQLLSDLKTGRIDAVLTWQMDRLCRRTADGGKGLMSR